MRKKIVGSSWKIHVNSFKEAETLSRLIAQKVGHMEDVEIFFLPSFPLIQCIANNFKGTNIKYGAQNVCVAEKGAHTGEVPVNLLKEMGCTYVEVGHAERRAMYGETNPVVNQKVRLCEKHGIVPIVCIGEDKEDRVNQTEQTKLKSQIIWALDGLTNEFRKKVILAYEPVWAIGQTQSADKEYIVKTHKFIRSFIKQIYGPDVAESIRIIYGGSASYETARELSGELDVDGLFIGRFGLSADNFQKIVVNFLGEKNN